MSFLLMPVVRNGGEKAGEVRFQSGEITRHEQIMKTDLSPFGLGRITDEAFVQGVVQGAADFQDWG